MVICKSFLNRQDAGQKLAERLAFLSDHPVLVFGIPRGGVVVASEIARALKIPLDVLIVRKIGVPGNAEVAAGAVGVDERPVWNKEVLKIANLSPEDLAPLVEKKILEVREREKAFGVKPFSVRNKTVILTDDGIATGATFEAALQWLKAQKPKKIIGALPCAPKETADRLRNKVSAWICLEETNDFSAVGQFYKDFSEVTDEQVTQILKALNR